MSKKPSEAYIPVNLFETGIGNIAVARFKGSGEVECGIFLLDIWCLGVKNAGYRRIGFEAYQELLNDFEKVSPLKQESVSCVRKLISGAVSYASSLGFSPHRDFKKAWRVMGGIDPDACDRIFTFGQEGKPHYFRGPRDSSAFSNRVMNTLTKRLGPGNFNFTVIEGDGFGDFFDEED